MGMIKLITEPRNKQKLSAVDRVKNAVILKKCDKTLPALNTDVVDLSPEAKLQLQSNRIFSRSKKFSIDDYNYLSKLEKSVLRSASSSVEKDAKKSLEMGLKVKKDLDKTYGEGNYVYVSIGTSPAGVGRVLEFMGVETKYLPISGLSACYEDGFYRHFYKDTADYIKFLSEQGISQEKIENDDKYYLFFDYTRTGRSLEVFKNMMQENFGINSENIRYKSFDYECYSSSAKKIDPEKYALDYIKDYVESEKIANFAGVPHLALWQIDEVDKCKDFENLTAKKFNFCLIDELSKKGFLKKNPSNDISL